MDCDKIITSKQPTPFIECVEWYNVIFNLVVVCEAFQWYVSDSAGVSLVTASFMS